MPAPDQSASDALNSLNEAGRRFVESVLSAWPAQSRTDSASIVAAMAAAVTQDRERWESMQQLYYARHLALFQRLANGETTPPDADNDRRFRAPEWRALPYFDYV